MNTGEWLKFDLNLFIDLVQIMQEIVRATDHDSLIVLIGETPAYLRPFLEPYRKVYNFAFSSWPYGCYWTPNGKIQKRTEMNELLKDTVDPDKANKYFEYLDKNSPLTRDFLRQKWFKVVLVDWSSGRSISGASIFFNRYVGNIPMTNECEDIEGAKPMFFISLAGMSYRLTNTEP